MQDLNFTECSSFDINMFKMYFKISTKYICINFNTCWDYFTT